MTRRESFLSRFVALVHYGREAADIPVAPGVVARKVGRQVEVSVYGEPHGYSYDFPEPGRPACRYIAAVVWRCMTSARGKARRKTHDGG